MSATKTMPGASLRVTHDGIRSHATVVRGQVAARLDDVLDAALQADPDLAAAYRDILADIAPRLCLIIRREIDGSRDAGCCWYSVELRNGINGDTITTRSHRLTSRDFRGWTPPAEEVQAENVAILRRAAAIGLARAEYWYGDIRTVADAVRQFC